MALVWEREAYTEEQVYRVVFDVRWDNVTNEIDRIRIYPQRLKERLTIRQDGQPDRVIALPATIPAIVPPQTLGAAVSGSILLTSGFGPYRYDPDGNFSSWELREDVGRSAATLLEG